MNDKTVTKTKSANNNNPKKKIVLIYFCQIYD